MQRDNDDREHRLQYVGHEPFMYKDNCDFFDQTNLDSISAKVTQLLQGVHPEDKRIVVPDTTLNHVMSRVYDDDRGNSRDMTDHVIAIVVDQIRDEFETIAQNNKLSIWTTQYNGDCDSHGLLRHPKIKLRNKHPKLMQFIEHRY